MRAAFLLLAICACRAEAPYPGDACRDACAHRAELGCLEEALAAKCIPVCRRAWAARLYDPICVIHADRAGMHACDVRCEGDAP